MILSPMRWLRPSSIVVATLIWASMSAATAQERPASAAPPLLLNEAVSLAQEDQPSVDAFGQDAAASEQAAVAARTLPDPQLTAGIQNFPVTGPVALNPTADEMTMYTIGVMREQVRRSRREAEAATFASQALVSRAEATSRQRQIQREVMIAWLNAVEAAAKQRLLARLINDLQTGRQVIEAGIPTGASTPALALQAQAEIGLAQAQLAEAVGQEGRARAELARWIGSAAHRPLPESIPALAPPPSDHAASVEDHPRIRVAQAQEQAAQSQARSVRASRRPNITWSVMYGWRPDYGDMVTAQVSVPLQLNRGQLQNRRIAEAESRADAAHLRAEDAEREIVGEYQAALADYRSAEAQLSVIRDRAIPSLEASFEVAEARYAAGQGTLEMPLNVVRRYVEASIQSVEQQGRRARAAAQMIYLVGGNEP